jgi:hypothetical protein
VFVGLGDEDVNGYTDETFAVKKKEEKEKRVGGQCIQA